jgi:hypothetical protein
MMFKWTNPSLRFILDALRDRAAEKIEQPFQVASWTKIAGCGSYMAFHTTFSMPKLAEITPLTPRKRSVRSLPLTRQNVAAEPRSTVDNDWPMEYPWMGIGRQLEGRYIVEWGR